ncbi:hypothetical protein JXD38_12055 [candidate division WOR-3 bacterium]|nr:hypothetical protein [candidate division WOR-3 bacterium]
MKSRRGAASAPWTSAEDRVLQRYVQRVLLGRYSLASEAASSCHRELARLPGFNRTERAVFGRMCERLNEAGRRVRRPWTTGEERVIDHCVREFAAGCHESVNGAVRVCRERLARLPESARPPGGPRGIEAVKTVLVRRTAPFRRHGRCTKWSPEETRIAERFALRLRDGRFRNTAEAAAACAREFARLNRPSPGRLAPAWPRTLNSVSRRLWRLARAAGRPAWRSRYKDWEQAVIGGYAQALVQGRYRDPLVAARDCRLELCRRRGKRRGPDIQVRGLTVLRNRLCRLAGGQGWSWHERLWLPGEKRILDRHVRRLARANPPSLRQAARDCRRELRELHARLNRSDPARRKAYRERTYATLLTYLGRMSKQAGRAAQPRWTDREKRMLRKYARAVISGRYSTSNEAADACYEELFKPVSREPGSVLVRGRTTRTRAAVRDHMRREAHRLGERWPKTRWTENELALLSRAVDWYERQRGTRRLRPGEAAVQGLQLELEQVGSHRGLEGCRGRFWKEWHRRHGA